MEINKEGGIFDYELDDKNTLTFACFSTYKQQQHLRVNSPFSMSGYWFVIDGTFKWCTADLCLIQITSKCNLGFWHVLAYIICPSETQRYVHIGLKKVGILPFYEFEDKPQQEGFLCHISDKGGAFLQIESVLRIPGIWCVFHFNEELKKALAGFKYKEFFAGRVEALQSRVFLKEEWLEFYNVTLKYLADNASGEKKYKEAVQLLTKLCNNKEKYCKTFMYKYRNHGMRANSGGEGQFSSLKNGVKNGLLRTPLLHSMQYLLKKEEEYEGKCIIAIRNLISKRKNWSLYVDNNIQDSTKLANRRFIVSTVVSENRCEKKFKVKHLHENVLGQSRKDTFYVVTYDESKEDTCFTCTCYYYLATLEPCACIIKCIQNAEIPSVVRTLEMQLRFLHPSLWIENHPLYNDAVNSLTTDGCFTSPQYVKELILNNKNDSGEKEGKVKQKNTKHVIDSYAQTIKTLESDLKTLKSLPKNLQNPNEFINFVKPTFSKLRGSVSVLKNVGMTYLKKGSKERALIKTPHLLNTESLARTVNVHGSSDELLDSSINHSSMNDSKLFASDNLKNGVHMPKEAFKYLSENANAEVSLNPCNNNHKKYVNFKDRKRRKIKKKYKTKTAPLPDSTFGRKRKLPSKFLAEDDLRFYNCIFTVCIIVIVIL